MKKRSFLETFKEKEEKDEELAPELSGRVWADMSAHALVNNYRAIAEQARGQFMLPMIKANAYGHGAVWAARVLMAEPGLYGFGVATLEEAQNLRTNLKEKGKFTKILVFSGAIPWSEAKGSFCEKFNLTPVISTDADWRLFLKGEWHRKISYEIKFNTGMNRLGLSPSLIGSIKAAMKNELATSHPTGILSHLACAETPDSKLSQQQRARFVEIKKELSEVFPGALFHLANSAAIWGAKNWGLDGLTDIVRPGLSLLGIPPWPGAPARGLLRVMQLEAQVVEVRKLKVGDSVGYSATYNVNSKDLEKSGEVYSAVLSVGYADGLSRVFSNQGQVFLNGALEKFQGMISMDLAVISCRASTKVGDLVQLLGQDLDIWAQSKLASTIPYELLTSVSSRVQRRYG